MLKDDYLARLKETRPSLLQDKKENIVIQHSRLIYFQIGKLLLAKLRQNKHRYFPSIKFVASVIPRPALVRELDEERNVVIKSERLPPFVNSVNPNYPHRQSVQLNT